MGQAKPQTFENHVRIVPAFHIVLFGILILNLIWSVVRVIRAFSIDSVVALLLAGGLLILFFCTRLFPLKVQDRLIRLEERLRMEKLLPTELRARIPEFTTSQLIALRFASDEELPELARKVLTEKIETRKAIKKMIRNWKADYLRV